MPVMHRDQETIGAIFDEYLDKESILFSDGWGAYKPLGEEFMAYCVVNHSKEFVNYKETV